MVTYVVILDNTCKAIHHDNEYAEQNGRAYPSRINLLPAQQIHGYEPEHQVIDDNPDCKAPNNTPINANAGM